MVWDAATSHGTAIEWGIALIAALVLVPSNRSTYVRLDAVPPCHQKSFIAYRMPHTTELCLADSVYLTDCTGATTFVKLAFRVRGDR